MRGTARLGLAGLHHVARRQHRAHVSRHKGPGDYRHWQSYRSNVARDAAPVSVQESQSGWSASGSNRDPREIEAEWRSLKYHPNKLALARRGASSCEPLTNLELTMVERQFLFDRVTHTHEMQLTAYFPDFADWPGDAQLGLMAMAWGLEMYFPPKFPRFTAACREQDFGARGIRLYRGNALVNLA